MTPIQSGDILAALLGVGAFLALACLASVVRPLLTLWRKP